MKTTPTTINTLRFTYLSSFAQYILDNQLESFTDTQHTIAYQLNIPLLQALNNLPEIELKDFELKSNIAFLNALAANQAEDYIKESIASWINNTLPHIDKHEVVAEDLTLILFCRKKALLQFLTAYCRDTEQILLIIEEIDFFLTKLQAATTETYINLLQEKIAEHAHFIEKINTASPSAIYVIDIKDQKIIYTNGKFDEVLGISGSNNAKIGFFNTLIHPDDIEIVVSHFQSLLNIEDKDIRSCKYRIRNKEGDYRWMRNYDTVFKRKEDNTVWQIIGVVIDVTKEKTFSDELRKREEQLREAQALVHIGSWSYEIKAGKLLWSDELYHIFQLDKDIVLSISIISSLILPEDIEFGQEKVKEAFQNRSFTEFQIRIVTKNGTLKFLHATIDVIVDKNDSPIELMGTAQDITRQHNLIEQLKQSEKLYKQAQALAHIGNWSADLLTNEISWSDEMFNIYEMPNTGKVTFEEWFTMIHPEDYDEILAYWQERIKDKEKYDKIHRVILKNGKVKTLHRKGEFILNKNGEALKIIGTTQDITAQHKIQQELKEKQTFIEKITDAAPSIITSYNVLSDKYVYINKGLKKLLGYDPNEVTGKGSKFFTALVHPDDIAQLSMVNYAALQEANAHPETNKVVETTYRMLHKNGSYRWLNTYAAVFDRNHLGQVEHVLRISLDVTDHMNDRQRMQEQELFIKQVADASPTILYLFDTSDNKFTYINQEIFYVLGFTPEEILEMDDETTLSLYHPDDLPLLPERKLNNKKFQHAHSMIQYECRLKNKKGDWCWLVVREVIFQQNKEGKPKQVLGAALDITKRKEMEHSLLQNAFQLQQSNANLEEFAYVASHDLKEPLRKISTFGDRIIQTQKERLNDDGKIYLKKIIDASQRMQIMINDLLSISMITGDRSFQPYNLQTILDEVKQTLEYKIEKQNVIIEVQPLPEANIVASQFRQLFQNLLSNAIKFTKEGSQPHIKIVWKYVDFEEINNLQLNKAARYLKLEFIDNGIGFEEEYASKIFQIFQRLHGRSEYEGTGIGLAICKKIIEHHGGAIYAHGYPDAGATFTIILPS